VDFYDEGVMIWLEADTLIRRETGGKRSLDDFCRRFFGGDSGSPTIKPYTFDDLTASLSEVLRHDWKKFFEDRLSTTEPHAGARGIEAAGWKLAYDAERSPFVKSSAEVRENNDLRFSLGIDLTKDGTVIDVVPDTPAARAGIGPGMKVAGVGGRRYTKERMRDALRGAMEKKEPIELLVENGEFLKTVPVDHHAGERYPHLARIDERPDVLTEILKPAAR
jgi:predicted metalloprotease with PDZ domain